MKQNYNNHIRYYPPHHFYFYSIILAATAWSGWHISRAPEHRDEWIAITLIIFLIGWLSFMLRQHYALTNQNRIVRLEVRLRYYQLAGKRFEDIEHKLTFGQIAALRFTSDEELVALTEKALNENMKPDAIKRSIKNWLPDNMRV